MPDANEGKTFSEVYTERGKPASDNAVLRGRLGMYLQWQINHSSQLDVAAFLSTQYGKPIYCDDLAEFFSAISLAELLNAITFVFRALAVQGDRAQAAWLKFVNVVFDEENLSYRTDNKCGVRYVPDQEFDNSRAATIAVLASSKYATVRQNYELALHDLRTPTLYGEAIRHTFDAVENLAKLMLPDKISRLGATEIEKQLGPLVLSRLSGPEKGAASQFLAGFKSWVNAAQQYRHAPGTEEPDPPSIEFAVGMVSAGASYLRWLAAFHLT